MNREAQIIMALTAYLDSSGKSINDFIKGSFLRKVESYETEKILAAIEEAMYSSNFPHPKVPVGILEAKFGEISYDYEALYEWDKYHSELRYRPAANVRFDHPITAYVAEVVLPILQYKQTMSESEEGILQNRFVKEFKALREKQDIFQHIASRELKLLSGSGLRALQLKIENSTNQKQIGGGNVS